MDSVQKILLLAGSAEARRIATALLGGGLQVRAWMSEPPRGPDPMPVPHEILCLDDPATVLPRMASFDAVIDASHGFDGQMTEVGAVAARHAGLPFISLSRPCWDSAESPLWSSAVNLQAAMAMLSPGERVFSAAGWPSLKACENFPGEVLFLRQTTPHNRPAPLPFVTLVFGNPPFGVADETALFRELRIDALICRNLGGVPSRPKLDAAKALGLKVILLDRPVAPEGVLQVDSVDQVLDWVAAL